MLLCSAAWAVTFDCNAGGTFDIGARGIGGRADNYHANNIKLGYYTAWSWVSGMDDWTHIPISGDNYPSVLDMERQLRDHGCSTRAIWKANSTGDYHRVTPPCGYAYCASAHPVWLACNLDSVRDTVVCTRNALHEDTAIQFSAAVGNVAAGVPYYVKTVQACTMDDASNTVTCTSHGFLLNDPINFSTTIGGVVPMTSYYVKTIPNTNTFTLSTSAGGPTFNITTDGVHTANTAFCSNRFKISTTAPGGPVFNMSADGSTNVSIWRTACNTYAGKHFLPLDITSQSDTTTDFVTNTDLLARRAANLAYYVNKMLFNYRSNANNGGIVYQWGAGAWVAGALSSTDGTSYHDSSAQIAASIAWFGGDYRKILLTTTEAPGGPTVTYVPKAHYWEVGNEPELDSVANGAYNMYLSPAQYRDRYAAIRTALRDADVSVAVGPCLTSIADFSTAKQYVDTLVSAGQPMDFVGHHPYLSIGRYFQPLDVPQLEGWLNSVKNAMNGVRDAAIRYSNTVMNTEYDPSGWCYNENLNPPNYVHRSLAHALGVAESVFTFAEQARSNLASKVISANYWCDVWPATTEIQTQLFQMLAPPYTSPTYNSGYLGDWLIGSYVDTNNKVRVYCTKWASGTNKDIYVWGLNFNNTTDVVVPLYFTNLPTPASSYTVTQYGLWNSVTGNTRLNDLDMTWVGPYYPYVDPRVGWGQSFEQAAITLTIIHPNP